jgi:hypothetical protein
MNSQRKMKVAIICFWDIKSGQNADVSETSSCLKGLRVSTSSHVPGQRRGLQVKDKECDTALPVRAVAPLKVR